MRPPINKTVYGKTVAEVGTSSVYFKALKSLPVYIESDGKKYFNGQWAPYAKGIDTISGSGIVPENWAALSSG